MRTLLLLAFLWFGGNGPLTYTVSRNADPVVGVAVEMLQGDLQEVTGVRPQPARSGATLRIVQYDRERTRQFNEELAGGKWRGLMCDHPRDLPLYWAPDLPVSLTDAEIAKWGAYGQDWHAPEVPAAGRDYYAANACDYTAATAPVRPVRSLGHSGRAVPVPKGASLRYDFRTESSGKAVIRVAVIPTQALDKGDIRFSVSVDGGAPQVLSIKEPYRSDRWKQNVMRGQAVVAVPVELGAGVHTLTLSAVDDHIIFDQWMADFKPARRFYLFPL